MKILLKLRWVIHIHSKKADNRYPQRVDLHYNLRKLSTFQQDNKRLNQIDDIVSIFLRQLLYSHDVRNDKVLHFAAGYNIDERSKLIQTTCSYCHS